MKPFFIAAAKAVFLSDAGNLRTFARLARQSGVVAQDSQLAATTPFLRFYGIVIRPNAIRSRRQTTGEEKNKDFP